MTEPAAHAAETASPAGDRSARPARRTTIYRTRHLWARRRLVRRRHQAVLTPGRWLPLAGERMVTLTLLQGAVTGLWVWCEPAIGPVDLVQPALIAVSVTTVIAVVGLPWRHLLRSRPPVAVTGKGIETDGGLVLWSEITGIDVVHSPGGRHLELVRHFPNPRFRLWSLTGAWPLRDCNATRYFSAITVAACVRKPGIRVRTRRWGARLAAVVVVSLIAAGAAQIAERGLVSPWAPTVPIDTTACHILEQTAPHFASDWLGLHSMTTQPATSTGETSCVWASTYVSTLTSAGIPLLRSVTLTTLVHGWEQLSHPVTVAARAQTFRLAGMAAAQPLPYMPGSQVVLVPGSMSIAVYGQRANVTLSITIACNGACPASAQHDLGRLASRVLDGIDP
jgi:hypothetical protein